MISLVTFIILLAITCQLKRIMSRSRANIWATLLLCASLILIQLKFFLTTLPKLPSPTVSTSFHDCRVFVKIVLSLSLELPECASLIDNYWANTNFTSPKGHYPFPFPIPPKRILQKIHCLALLFYSSIPHRGCT